MVSKRNGVFSPAGLDPYGLFQKFGIWACLRAYTVSGRPQQGYSPWIWRAKANTFFFPRTPFFFPQQDYFFPPHPIFLLLPLCGVELDSKINKISKISKTSTPIPTPTPFGFHQPPTPNSNLTLHDTHRFALTNSPLCWKRCVRSCWLDVFNGFLSF
jgi:hypothetical protein